MYQTLRCIRVLFLVLLVSLAGCQETAKGPSNGPTGKTVSAFVIHILDGDTIEVITNDSLTKVRMLLIDTPDTHTLGKPVEPWGPEALDYTKVNLEGRNVKLELTTQEEQRDQYGRLLAFVYLGNKSFNEDLVRLGLARVAYTYPGAAHFKDLMQAQTEAKDARINIWRIEGYVQDDGFHSDKVPPSTWPGDQPRDSAGLDENGYAIPQPPQPAPDLGDTPPPWSYGTKVGGD